MEDFESLYQQWLNAYRDIEADAPLTAADARRLGGQAFEQQMRQAIQAGAYSDEWIERLNQFSLKLHEWLGECESQLSYKQRNCFLRIRGDVRQIHPRKALRQSSPISAASPDTVADQLAQGATLCQLF